MPFRQLVNTLRLAYYIQLVLLEKSEKQPLECLGRKAGWANRSTFYGAVKYHTGLTTSELIAIIS